MPYHQNLLNDSAATWHTFETRKEKKTKKEAYDDEENTWSATADKQLRKPAYNMTPNLGSAKETAGAGTIFH